MNWFLDMILRSYRGLIDRPHWTAGRAARLQLEIEAANARIRVADPDRSASATPGTPLTEPHDRRTEGPR